MTDKLEPFLRQRMNAEYKFVPFEKLNVSVATMDVRLIEDAEIHIEKLINLLPVVDKELFESNPGMRWGPGIITGMKYKNQKRGRPPNLETKGFKNSVTIWIWLESKESKPVCAKISKDSIHITGCKSFENSAETAKHIQTHLRLLTEAGHQVYKNFPYAIEFFVYMVNFNFNIQVAVDLVKFDLFIDKNCKTIYSPYNQNIHHTTMPVKCPDLSSSYTIHDNGQICMCAKNVSVDAAMEFSAKSYILLTTLLEWYKKGDKVLNEIIH